MRKTTLLMAPLWGLLTSTVHAQQTYELGGQLDLRSHYYNNSGDPSTTFYSDEGIQSYGLLNLDFTQHLSAYRDVQANLGLLLNDSSFKGQSGASLERAHIAYTNGEGAMPLRVNSGDILAYFSQRTLQTSLIGSQIELQPAWGNTRHSLQVFTGLANSDYRDFSTDNVFSGASWLSELSENGSYSVNLIHNRKQGNSQNTEQIILSTASNYDIQLGNQAMSTEAEFAYLDGDTVQANTVQNASDTAVFFELSGEDLVSNLQASYQFSYQRYGETYTPEGAAVTADRESIEGRFSFSPLNTLNVQTRLQRFEDNIDSGNKLSTQVMGIGSNGSLSLFKKAINFSTDAFVNQASNKQDTVDTDTQNLRLNVSMPLTTTISTHLSLQNNKTHNNNDGSRSKNDVVNLGLRLPIDYLNWRGSISPSINLNSNNSGQQTTGLVSINASNGQHNVALSVRALDQNQHTNTAIDSVSSTLALRYHYRFRQHSFGLEYDSQYRSPEPGASSQGHRIGLNYKMDFAYRPSSGLARSHFVGTLSPIVSYHPVNLGDSSAKAKAILADHKLNAQQVGNYLISEAMLFDFTNARQLLVSHNASGTVNTVGIIVQTNNTDEIGRTLANMLSEFTNVLGSPTLLIEEGEFTTHLQANLDNGSFQRLYGWQQGTNKIYLGIPVRTDGQARIELITGNVGDPVNSGGFWGFQEIVR